MGATDASQASRASQAVLQNTEQHVLQSSATGKRYLVQVALPHGYTRSPNSVFDVIFAPDANLNFGAYASCTQSLPIMGEGRPVIMVAVGYPVDDLADAVDDRQDDLMPEVEAVPEEMKALSTRSSVGGGAAAFRQFLTVELRDFIARRYRVNESGYTLYGHSTGGTFAVDTLFDQPESFSRYIIISPWLSFADGVGLRQEARYAARNTDLRARVFVAAGGLEDEQPLISDMQIGAFTRRFAQRLQGRRYPSLELHVHEFADEGHVTMVTKGLLHGFRALFGSGTPADRELAFPSVRSA